MSTPGTSNPARTTQGSSSRSPVLASDSRSAPADATVGKTSIADTVVSKIAGLAAREVNGVRGFGGGAARAFGAIAERIPGARSSSTQGVSVEVGERQAAIDLTIVVEYGVSIPELARGVRRNVTGAIEQMTGLEVVEININVNDLHLPGDEDGEDDGDRSSRPARVQ